MFRSIADCLDTLEEAGARYYSITGTGTNLSFEPEDENGATVEASLARFERDFNKLGPGRYTVTHKKKSADNRSKATFSFFKSAEGATVGSTASADGYALADMQLKIQQIQHDNELYRLKRDHEDQIKALKAREDKPDGTDKLINAVGQINQLIQNAKTLPTPAVAGPGEQQAPDVPVDEQSTVVNDTVHAIHSALGGSDEDTMNFLRRIGQKAKSSPELIHQLKMML